MGPCDPTCWWWKSLSYSFGRRYVRKKIRVYHFGPLWVSMLNFEGVMLLIILTKIILGQFRTIYVYCMGSKHIPLPVCMFKDDFPFPQVGYVSCLEGMATSTSHDLSLVLSWETFPFHICPRDVLCPKLRRGEGPVAEVSPTKSHCYQHICSEDHRQH